MTGKIYFDSRILSDKKAPAFSFPTKYRCHIFTKIKLPQPQPGAICHSLYIEYFILFHLKPSIYLKLSTAALSIARPAAYLLMNSSKPATSAASGSIEEPALPTKTLFSRKASNVSSASLLSI